jgi:hypothetical protein
LLNIYAERLSLKMLEMVLRYGYLLTVSSVAEIESAIERLSGKEVAELAAWFEEYQQMINASAEIFALYEDEEDGSERDG